MEMYLKRCLDSLINQTIKEIEIICINDGSTDGSVEILENYKTKDNRIKVINTTNSGPAAARNLGIEIARGEYIGFVDADDWVDLNYYRNLYNISSTHDCDIAVAGIMQLHSFKQEVYLKFSNIKITNDVNMKFFICDVPNTLSVWNKIYRTSYLKNFDIRFEESRYLEDVNFTMLVLYHSNRIVTVPDTYYYNWQKFDLVDFKTNAKAEINKKYASLKVKEFVKKYNINLRYPPKKEKCNTCSNTVLKFIKRKK